MESSQLHKRQEKTITNGDVGVSHNRPCNAGKSSYRLGKRTNHRERDDKARGIKEAVHIRILPNMNRDEGRFHLSHLYDDLLGVVART